MGFFFTGGSKFFEELSDSYLIIGVWAGDVDFVKGSASDEFLKCNKR